MKNIARNLLNEINSKVLNLSDGPEIYVKIGKVDKLKRNYYRIVIRNYIILYTIDKNNKKVYISHIMYSRRKYLN